MKRNNEYDKYNEMSVLMNKRLAELILKRFLTIDEIFEINSMEEVDKIDYNGHIGTCLNYQYPHTVYLLNGKKYDVYLIFN